ncbi:ABC transporter permease [Exiguobacterium sp. SL14]|nr:ABC transporter permease [Exiguobacterium sp. SL14]MCY1691564.1 ABC transporter permease [Exiguobacterium sp. SL14]
MVRETWFLMRRSLLVTLRNPFSFIPNLIISVFFLLVYTSGLSSISNLPQFDGVDYLNFILPVSIVSGAVGGAGGAGQALVKDIESGYFARLLLTPVSRTAIVLGPMLAGMLQLFVQTLLIFGMAFLLGLSIPVGVSGFFLTILLALGFGLAFAGYSVGVALKTRNAQAAQAGTLLFFPLIFLSTTFVPKDLIEAEWLKIATTINPTTYIMEGMRSVLTRPEIDWSVYWQGLIVVAVLSIVMVVFVCLECARGIEKIGYFHPFLGYTCSIQRLKRRGSMRRYALSLLLLVGLLATVLVLYQMTFDITTSILHFLLVPVLIVMTLLNGRKNFLILISYVLVLGFLYLILSWYNEASNELQLSYIGQHLLSSVGVFLYWLFLRQLRSVFEENESLQKRVALLEGFSASPQLLSYSEFLDRTDFLIAGANRRQEQNMLLHIQIPYASLNKKTIMQQLTDA